MGVNIARNHVSVGLGLGMFLSPREQPMPRVLTVRAIGEGEMNKRAFSLAE
jgi:hypothetical protein